MYDMFAPDAFKNGVDQLIGKPVTLTLDGRKRTIGEITGALVNAERGAVYIRAQITDEEVAGLLGAAQDKNQAAESEIGMSEREIEAALGYHGPTSVTFDSGEAL